MVNYKYGQFKGDENKAKNRQWMADRIAAALPGDRSDYRAAGLAGDSLIEWDQIYKPLGFSPRNVTLVERDLEAYNRADEEAHQRPRNERPRLYFGSLEDYMEEESTAPHAVWNFDFVQNYGVAHASALESLFSRPDLLDEKSVLLLNSQARREHPNVQWRLFLFTLLGGQTFQKYFSKLYNGTSEDREIENTGKFFIENSLKMLGLYYFNKDMETPSLRDPKITLTALRHGVFYDVFLRSRFSGIRNKLSEDEAKQILEEIDKRNGDDFLATVYQNIERFRMPGEKVDPLTLAVLMSNEGGLELVLKSVAKISEDRLAQDDPENAYFRMINATPLTPVGFKTYKYVGSSGTPMRTYAINFRHDPFVNETIEKMTKKINLLKKGKTPADRIADSHMRHRFGENYTFFDLMMVGPREMKSFRSLFQILRESFDMQRPVLKASNLVDFLEEESHTQLDYLNELYEAFSQSAEGVGEFLESNIGVLSSVPEIEPEKYIPIESVEVSAPRIELSEDDKEAIRSLADEGYRPKMIWESLFSDTEISLPQVSAICARHLHAKSWAS